VGSTGRISGKILSSFYAIASHSQSTHSAMREWTPPDHLFDWDKVMNHVRKGVLLDGFDRYIDWHVKLKRRANELAEQLPQEGSSKRLKKG